MVWQDMVFAAGGMIFVLCLLPLAVNPNTRVVRSAAFLNAGTLAAFAGTYLSLGLGGAAATTAMTAGLWAWLGWRRAIR